MKRQERSLGLTEREERLLAVLKAQPGKVFSAEELYERVWEEAPFGAANVVAVHIYHIRRKRKDLRIKTVWRRGYKLEE
ncbi:MAG: winged helix-turn-helix domain-containing protein [Clostridia bacterium]|nr:winged helix-turn-helix domain-containing protein [Clostridia bacterium]